METRISIKALRIAVQFLCFTASAVAFSATPDEEDWLNQDLSRVPYGKAGQDYNYSGDNYASETGVGTVYFHILDEQGQRTPISITELIPGAPTYFITHGFTDGVGDNWLTPETDLELSLDDRISIGNFKLNVDDLIDWQAFSAISHQIAMSILFYHQDKGQSVNVILVDWGDFSLNYTDVLRAYTNAAKFRVPMVGKAIADYITLKNIDPANITLIGHSLGAHASGFAGQEIQRSGRKIATIIGMDAAGPWTPFDTAELQFTYHHAPPQYRLSVGDAENVFDIHTSEIWGFKYPLAKYDLYVNATVNVTGMGEQGQAGDWTVSYNHQVDNASGTDDHSYSRCFLANMFIEAVRLKDGSLPPFMTEQYNYLDGDGNHLHSFRFYHEKNFNVTFYTPQNGMRAVNDDRKARGLTPLTIDTFLMGHADGGFFEDFDPKFYWNPATLATADVGRSDLIPSFPEDRSELPPFSDYVKFWNDFPNELTGTIYSSLLYYSVEHSPDFASKVYNVPQFYPVTIVHPETASGHKWLSFDPDLSGYAPKYVGATGSGIKVTAHPPAGYRFGSWQPTEKEKIGAVEYYTLNNTENSAYNLQIPLATRKYNPKNPTIPVIPSLNSLDPIDALYTREKIEIPVRFSLSFDTTADPTGDYDGDGIANASDAYPKFNHLKATFTPGTVYGYYIALDADYPRTNPAYSVDDPRHKLEAILPNSVPESLVAASRAAKNPTSESRLAMAETDPENETFTAISGIADGGLSYIEGLQSITIGKFVETVGADAFGASTTLADVVFTSKTAPELAETAFSNIPDTRIVVPSDSTGYGNEGDLYGGSAVVFETLESFQNGELVRGLLAVLENGDTQVDIETFSRMVTGLLTEVSEEYGIPAPIINPSMIDDLSREYINEFSSRFGPTLSTIRNGLITLDDTIQSTRGGLKNVGDFLAELQDQLSVVDKIAAGEFDPFSGDILADFRIEFEIWKQTYEGHFHTPEFQEALMAYLEQLCFDLATEFIFPDMQLALRQRIQDLRASIQSQIDSVFAMVEQAIRDKLTELVAGLDLGVIDTSFLSPLDQVCAAGELNGHAVILGDRLDLLRIDAKFEMKAPDKLAFAGYLQIKCLNSQGNGGCSYEGAEFHEFTIGALDVPVAFLGGDVGMNIETAFTFADTGFPLRGLAGKIEMSRGTLEFETFKILDLGAAMAFGQHENYLACAAALQLNQYKVAGGLFFGRTCTIDPMTIAHEQTAELLWSGGGGTFTGALVYGFASIPISEALGIPASCMFYVSAGFGGGVFFSTDGPTFGGIMELDVGGEALCAVGVNGNVSLVGLKTGNDYRFSGQGRIGGKVGKCPFCLKFSKSVGIEFAEMKWKLSL